MKKGTSFEEAVTKVTDELKKVGFGVLTEIDIQSTFKKKLDVDTEKYVILGACNPHYAYDALKSDSKLGVFLPCNVIVEEHKDGSIEVFAVDPLAAMMAVKNRIVEKFAEEVKQNLEVVVNAL